MAPVAGGVQRRRGFGDVLAHDRRVADLAVALRQLVVREADGAGVVRGLGLLQRAAVQRDGARLVAARRRQPSVQPPQRRQPDGRDGVAEGVGCASERGGRLVEIVLLQPRFGEHRAQRQLVVARERRPERRREHLRGVGAVAALERGGGARASRACREERGHYRFVRRVSRNGRPLVARRASRRAEQSQSLHDHGSGAVQILAAAPRVRVLHFVEVEVLLPVFALFGERLVAVADLHPLHAAVIVRARVAHVAVVLAAGDRTPAERALVDGVGELRLLSGFDARCYQVAHGAILRRHPADATRPRVPEALADRPTEDARGSPAGARHRATRNRPAPARARASRSCAG